jgi:hypothetical protein
MNDPEDGSAPAAAPESAGTVRRVTVTPEPPSSTARRTRRLAVPGMLVEIEAPGISDQPWVVAAVDLSAEGMGLVLPDALAPGTPVLLTFQLGGGCNLARVPATVLHRQPQAGGGGVTFDRWPPEDRLCLLEFLVRWYEGSG